MLVKQILETIKLNAWIYFLFYDCLQKTQIYNISCCYRNTGVKLLQFITFNLRYVFMGLKFESLLNKNVKL